MSIEISGSFSLELTRGLDIGNSTARGLDTGISMVEGLEIGASIARGLERRLRLLAMLEGLSIIGLDFETTGGISKGRGLGVIGGVSIEEGLEINEGFCIEEGGLGHIMGLVINCDPKLTLGLDTVVRLEVKGLLRAGIGLRTLARGLGLLTIGGPESGLGPGLLTAGLGLGLLT